ncbi:hypothetical protein Srot_0889 [Segniliparus rotundus DSM 44985]|uniref:DUF3987 domain-containing protein n=1 Tax=Segniliparus rotundus (strain ATCC BAA-972 / CDC 1076 / CIP 108378 / DSM 44985 / JCM 13578) TaxID=640132 RepID=D6ZE86_SEGRD|nr:hypothetical protein [Segniliparus rotundus]ADG97366.1 hypothetical protein Srot_0889 [Segniliparus rotundus DSM 44985]
MLVPITWEHDSTADPNEDVLFEAVFHTGLPLLERLRLMARGYQACSPWGALAKALCVAACDGAKTSVLTGTGVRTQPLNLMVGFVAPSGIGKGQAMGLPLVFHDPMLTVVRDTPASGEALIHFFFEETQDEDGKRLVQRHDMPVWADWPEIDHFAAKTSGKGSTLESTLRSVFSGESFGDKSLSRQKDGFGMTVEAGTYRCVATVGVQPKRAAPLLRDGGGGTLQRLLWMAVDDPDAPDPSDIPAIRAELAQSMGLPHVPPTPPTIQVNGPKHVTVDAAVSLDIMTNRTSALRLSLNPDDTHRDNLRVRIAAIYAGWVAGPNAHAVIDLAAWDWADAVLEHSNRVRHGITKETEKEDRDQAAKRGMLAGISRTNAEEYLEASHETRIENNVKKITAILQGGGRTKREIRNSLDNPRRKYLDEALERAVESGEVVEDFAKQYFARDPKTGNLYDPTNKYRPAPQPAVAVPAQPQVYGPFDPSALPPAQRLLGVVS